MEEDRSRDGQSMDDDFEMQQVASVLTEVDGFDDGRILSFCWGNGSELFCCDVDGCVHVGDVQEQQAGGVFELGPKGKQQSDAAGRSKEMDGDLESKSSCIRWGMLGPAQRRVAYDTSSKYFELASVVGDSSLDRSSKLKEFEFQGGGDTIEFAQCVSDILGATTFEAEEDAFQILQEKALWELVCLFTFDSAVVQQMPTAVPDVCGWYRANATAMCGSLADSPWSSDYLDRVQVEKIPELEESYWSVFIRLVAIGWMSEALDLLGLHSAWMKWDSNSIPGDSAGLHPAAPIDNGDANPQLAVLEGLNLLLRRFPTWNERGAAGPNMTRKFETVEELMSFRSSWISQCEQLAQQKDIWVACKQHSPKTAAACLTCLEILMGKESALLEATTSWAELFVANVTHKYPDLKSLSELKQLLEESMKYKPEMDEYQMAVAAAMESSCDIDHQGVLRACSNIASDWFMAHIGIILESHPAGPGPLCRELEHAGGDQLEFYRLEYACSLAPHPSTWNIAVKYFGFCRVHGKSAAQHVMQNLPLSSNGREANRAIKEAETFGLELISDLVRKKQGALCWQYGLFSLGAYWFSAAEDVLHMDMALAGFLQPEPRSDKALQLNDIESCLLALKEQNSLSSVRNFVSLFIEICLEKETKEDLQRALVMLRSVDRDVAFDCVLPILKHLSNIRPDFLETEDVLQLLEVVNDMAHRKESANLLDMRKTLAHLTSLSLAG